ncbi:hypothetical protein SACE_6538 [Saccharopolyspora erythraea NRRL 2338]|uniref:Uncharacterized protein n=1 Tax=Saccharopolyspora erythraea (strain ATCC 11635 / DSM 40517 / JCM 4748 / NBRC 13426 / NCIMB 8594 / NRRL 2338) TaxID=405948 RepID=A4FNT1_SACEN|nr:hypothetical protein SACE_6538 [Saccharopolyspora erythraea NRRL 2338]
MLRRRSLLESMTPDHDGQLIAAEARSRRCRTNLALLRAPLAGLDLDTRDQATLTWLADRDPDAVNAVRALLERARAAPPIPDRVVAD